LVGAISLVALFGAATWSGYTTVEELTRSISEQLAGVERSAQFSTDLETALRQQIEAGNRYVTTGDPMAREQFRRLGASATELTTRYMQSVPLVAAETAALTTITRLRSEIEVELAAAHDLTDAGLPEEAAARAAAAVPLTTSLMTTLRGFSVLPAQRLAASASDLQQKGSEGQRWLLIVFAFSSALAVALLMASIESVGRPLRRLQKAARRMGDGDLRVEVDGKMLREFRALAQTFNAMGSRLRGYVQETIDISDHISTSAQELSTISDEVAGASGEVASAMALIRRSAESQSEGIQETAAALDEMRRRGSRIDEAAQRVVELSEGIREVAERHRVEMAGAVRQVYEVRGIVESSETEARELATASLRIDKLVETISNVARQTNLLSLNAAIEAARAGENGRGFAVVAEEVRKLADGSSEAAREVSAIVHEVRTKIDRMVQTMEKAARQVDGVEGAARAAEVALQQIMGTVAGVTDATSGVNEALLSNRQALKRVETALGEVSSAAESHTVSAQQVAAAAEQQSAATVQVSAASNELRAAASRMKELVRGLKT
jgi:methyl-accepting chemotaxis protein